MRKFKQLAARSEYSNRSHESEKEHVFRDKFTRDRDRILYSKAFRRLSGKTQVFVTSFDDHARTRLTHTLEVVQIAKTIANRLGFNETLTEAIAFGHDIGHTPFGHVGERTLNLIMNGCIKIKDINLDMPQTCRGYKHNWQGVRVVEDLEEKDRRWRGLNLTDYTVWGILNHSKVNWGQCNKSYGGESAFCGIELRRSQECNQYLGLGFYEPYLDIAQNMKSWSFEALIVEMADEIAQRHHDIEDGIEAKIVDRKELIEVLDSSFSEWLGKHSKNFRELSIEEEKEFYIPKFSRFIIDLLVTELVVSCQENVKDLISKYSIKKYSDFYEIKNQLCSDFIIKSFSAIKYTKDFEKSEKVFHSYLKSKILNSYHAQRMDGRSQFVIKQLFKAYVTNPQQLPDSTIKKICKRIFPESKIDSQKSSDHRRVIEEMHYDQDNTDYRMALLRTITDYIGGMTDSFAIKQHQNLYGISREY